ncbi:glycosyltransferase family 4 protein [Haliovirga abyssi]|uniref:Glycosyl transferase family 1 n=1 Tax=Haliovirga abyssi TaxID=2996794 RepID=A0AAU9DV00_9FUSO|nr:glycosyltransferase family 4 protein [Haliovirga abyssi]BDU51114.1 glycosyl transferase family 1 [Haliovirga abyssi]
MDNLKIVYIEKKAHKLHKEFAKSVGVEEFSYFLLPIFDREFIRRNAILHQIFSMFSIFFIPKADIYIVDAINKSLPVIIKKIFNKNIKIVAINSNSFFRDLEFDKKIVLDYKLWLCKYIDGIISTTYEIKKIADKYINIKNEVVYPFIDTKRLENIKIDYNKKAILTIGGPSKIKGTDILIEAFIGFNKKYKDYKLYIIGEDILYNNYKKRYSEYKNIIFTGYEKDIRKYFEKSSIYIQPSRSDAAGMAVLESMYCGILPIVSKNVGLKEIVEKVEKNFVIDLSKKNIVGILESIEKKEYNIKELGEKAKEVTKKYSEDRQKEKFKKVFLSVLRNV